MQMVPHIKLLRSIVHIGHRYPAKIRNSINLPISFFVDYSWGNLKCHTPIFLYFCSFHKSYILHLKLVHVAHKSTGFSDFPDQPRCLHILCHFPYVLLGNQEPGDQRTLLSALPSVPNCCRAHHVRRKKQRAARILCH